MDKNAVVLTYHQIRQLGKIAEVAPCFSVENTNLPRVVAAVECSNVDDKPYPDARVWLINADGQSQKFDPTEDRS